MQQPHERQILVSLGNRYVVFGSGVFLPSHRQLGPEDVKHVYARVGDEREGVERRIVESLTVDGFDVQSAPEAEFGDVMIVDRDGGTALVEIKVGDRDFAGMNLDQAWAELASAAGKGERREIWAFNIERLGLGIVWSEGPFAARFEQLPALNVWEFGADGTVFARKNVLERLDEWSRRIEAVYTEVEAWAQDYGLTTSRNRTVPMSEELMQKHAVPDRDLPILDVAADTGPVASFVPVGLWLIFFNGQINIITKTGTYKLGDRASYLSPPDWILINPFERSMKSWTQNEFGSVVGLVPAHE